MCTVDLSMCVFHTATKLPKQQPQKQQRARRNYSNITMMMNFSFVRSIPFQPVIFTSIRERNIIKKLCNNGIYYRNAITMWTVNQQKSSSNCFLLLLLVYLYGTLWHTLIHNRTHILILKVEKSRTRTNEQQQQQQDKRRAEKEKNTFLFENPYNWIQ